jgi:uncharacterized OsmC-like protein
MTDNVINGINLKDLSNILKEIETNKEFVQQLNKWYARVRWSGEGFKFKAYVRNHVFEFSEPSELGGPDTAPNPVEYILSALGACLATGFVFNATKEGVIIKNLEIALEGEINNILVYLGLSKEGHPGYKKIIAKAYVQANADEEKLQQIWEYTVKTSPVGNTLTNVVELVPEIKVT